MACRGSAAHRHFQIMACHRSATHRHFQRMACHGYAAHRHFQRMACHGYAAHRHVQYLHGRRKYNALPCRPVLSGCTATRGRLALKVQRHRGITAP
eukprot:363433-Chlamydomonas_euryale.AAC.8